MSQEAKKIIIIRKKKAHAHAHHGGSWKVAYADFVTAMMAFFMVMWILGMDENMKESIESYFSNPVGHKQAYSSGNSPISTGSSPANVQITPLRLVGRSYQQAHFQRIGDRIRERLEEAGLGEIGARIEVVMTDDGLRIELIESGPGEPFFPFGSAAVKSAARRALEVVARELGGDTDVIVVEGHMDAAPFGSPGYSNWELSADRALRNPADPLDRSNRRTSVLLPFTTLPEAEPPAPPAPAGTV